MSYTDFLISTGIRADKRDPEYVSIIKATIEELYTMYGICLYKDEETTSETINTKFNTETALEFQSTKDLVVKSSDGLITYLRDTDYIVDEALGIIQLLDTGSMLEDTDYSVFYTYYIFQNKSNTFEYEIYPKQNTSVYNVYAKPINKILFLEYDNVMFLEDTDYYFYDNKLELATTTSNLRKPLKLTLDVGYTKIPADLKQAFYEYVEFKFDVRDRKANLIKTIDSADGQSTTYNPNTPKHIKYIFRAYSPNPMVK
jgi:hypothetical protein